MNNFKKNKYFIKRKVMNLDTIDFVKDYLKLRKESTFLMFQKNLIPPSFELLGGFTDKQIPNTFSIYGDVANEILLKKIKPIMEKITGVKLIETYSYARVYKTDDELKRHKDRASCDISATLNLGGTLWPIYLEPSGKVNQKGIKVNLKQGDMLVYSGCELEHWREPFKGTECVQVFLHYNKKGSKNKYDGRDHLGLPAIMKI
jgi:hypothetical protein|tara:strand:- start:890 stop:1498 length:609 start_codon:yes stop_codon:yes gene_type:complete